MTRPERKSRPWNASLFVIPWALLVLGCAGADPEPSAAPTTTTAAPTTTTAAPTTTTAAPTTTLPIPEADSAEETQVLRAVIDQEEVDVGGMGVGFRITYESESILGEPIEVTGLIVAPDLSPTKPRPVLSVAHGTVGLADQCAPSKRQFPTPDLALIEPFINAGWVVVASDYEGLGSPGLHRYIVGESEARGVFDIVRAARSISGLGATGPLVVWGHSQGGHTAMHAGQRWTELAPELDLVGVAAGAPPSQFPFLNAFLRNGPFQGYLVMVGASWSAAYPELDFEQFVNPEYLPLLEELEKGCTGHIFDVFNPIPYNEFLSVDDLLAIPEWNARMMENDPGQNSTQVPTVILHGTNDEQIPFIASQLLLGQQCAFDNHPPIELKEYPETNHGTSVAAYWNDLFAWSTDRINGEEAVDQCES